MPEPIAENGRLDLGERPADCGCCTVVDEVALGQMKQALVSVQAALDYDGDPRGVSCGGLDIYASGCFAGDLARRVKEALPAPPPPVPEYGLGDYVEVELSGEWLRGLIVEDQSRSTFGIAVVGHRTLAYGNPAVIPGAEKFLRYPSNPPGSLAPE